MSRIYVKNFTGYRRIFQFVTGGIITTVSYWPLSRVIMPQLVSIINTSGQLAE
jgi:hypothetical protein